METTMTNSRNMMMSDMGMSSNMGMNMMIIPRASMKMEKMKMMDCNMIMGMCKCEMTTDGMCMYWTNDEKYG